VVGKFTPLPLASSRTVKMGSPVATVGFFESVTEVSAKLKEANTKGRKFEDMVNSADRAAVLVLVY
jgi:hypothetical protein